MKEKTTPMRQQMIEDMEIRGLCDKRQKEHIRNVKHLCVIPRVPARHSHGSRPHDTSPVRCHRPPPGYRPPAPEAIVSMAQRPIMH